MVEAIDSVIAQRYPSVEIIVVDDGSANDTVAVVQRKLQRDARKSQVLELAANSGLSAARNAGFRNANGSWVQFLDSNDVLMPHMIERQMAVCATVPADVAAIYSPWNWGFFGRRADRVAGTTDEADHFRQDSDHVPHRRSPAFSGSVLDPPRRFRLGGRLRRSASFLGMRRSLRQAGDGWPLEGNT